MSAAGYAPTKAHFEILEVLASIAAYQDAQFVPGVTPRRWGRAGAWCIVRQRVIRAWYERLFRRYERSAAELCRRTLQYHLAALRRMGHLSSEQRHTNQRGTRKLAFRPSLYRFTARGRQWISRRAGWVENPAAMLAAQKIAQSGFNPDPESSTSLSRAVDKNDPQLGKSQTPRKSAAARRRQPRATLTRSAIAGSKNRSAAPKRKTQASARHAGAPSTRAPQAGRSSVRRRRRS